MRCQRIVMIIKLNQHLRGVLEYQNLRNGGGIEGLQSLRIGGGIEGLQNLRIGGGIWELQSLFSDLGGDVILIKTDVFIKWTNMHD